MKVTDAESFGGTQNDRFDDDLFSGAEFAQLLVLGLRRSNTRDGEPSNQGARFGIDSRPDAAARLNKRAAKFRESLFSALLEAVIEEGQRQRDISERNAPRMDTAQSVASGRQFYGSGIAHNGDGPAEHDVGYRNPPALGDGMHCLVESRILHLAIIGQNHDAVSERMADSHRVTGQWYRRECFLQKNGTCAIRQDNACGQELGGMPGWWEN